MLFSNVRKFKGLAQIQCRLKKFNFLMPFLTDLNALYYLKNAYLRDPY